MNRYWNVISSYNKRFSVACLGALLLSLTLSACATDIHQEIVTTEQSNSIEQAVTNSTALTDREKTAFQSAMNRADLGNYQPYGKSVGRVITDEEAFDSAEAAEQAAAAAKQTALRKALDDGLTIRPDGVSVRRGGNDIGDTHFDEPYDDIDTFTFIVTNNGSKYVSSFDADASLANKGGDVLWHGTFENADGIAPHASDHFTVVASGHDGSIPSPDTVRVTADSDLVLESNVTRIDYSDGTSALRSDLDTP